MKEALNRMSAQIDGLNSSHYAWSGVCVKNINCPVPFMFFYYEPFIQGNLWATISMCAARDGFMVHHHSMAN